MTPTQPRPAAFLDRDGVINIDFGYVHRVEDLVFTPTAAAGIRLFNEAGYWVFVVTNQSGVARGMYTLEDVIRFHEALRARLAGLGASIDAFYVAPYHPQGCVDAYTADHPDRKPGPGMLLRAMRDWPVLRRQSIMIGDKDSDRQAAEHAGVASLIVETDRCDLAREARRWINREGGSPDAEPHNEIW